MIDTKAKNNVQTSENYASTDFTIKNSAKAFKILSSGLYTNKIAAPIRELSTNAYDAHVQAGKKDKPFQVNLPTYLNPVFSIRDFGNGISEKDITNIYTKYFESTKSESNDYVGFLGLGSKSPFAYTDSFTVVSINNGKKSCYNCFINESGYPSILLISSENTSEESGLQVSFAVKSNDLDAFTKEAIAIYQWFEVKPISNIELNYPTFTYLGDGYYLSDSHKSGFVMGNVFYTHYTKENYIYKCNIGDLDVTASRESLENTNKTLSFIKERNKEIDYVINAYVKNIKNGKTDFEICLLYNKSPYPIKVKINPGDYSPENPVVRVTYRDGKLFKKTTNRISFLHNKCYFIFNDSEKNKSYQLAKQLYSNKNIEANSYIYLINEEQFEFLTDDFGVPANYFYKTSEFKFDNKPRPKKKKDNNIFLITKYSDNRISYCVEELDFNNVKNNVNYYVLSNNLSPEKPWPELRNIIRRCKEVGVSDAFYLIPNSKSKLIEKNPNWRNLDDLKNDLIKKFGKEIKEIEHRDIYFSLEKHLNISVFNKYKKMITTTSYILSSIEELLFSLGYEIPRKALKDLPELKQYPMLKVLFHLHDSKLLEDYIGSVKNV